MKNNELYIMYISKDQLVKELLSSKETTNKITQSDRFIKINGKQIY